MRVVLLSEEIRFSNLGLAGLLEREPSVVRVDLSDDVRSAGDADVVILEGLSAAECFGPSISPDACTRIVVLGLSDAEQRARLLNDSADLVLHGDVADHEIVAQVRAISRCQGPAHRRSGQRSNADDIVLEPDGRHALVLGRRIALTSLEGALLGTFIAQPGEVLNGRELMTQVWGSPFGGRSTVSAYIRRLRVKLEPDPSKPIFIRTVWGGGYVYRPDGGLS